MTTVLPEYGRCGVCGMDDDYLVMMSTSTFGSGDLDIRPPNLERSTICYWVYRCKYCGYCASDIREKYDNKNIVINNMEYKDQLNNPTYPELANSFLCKAILDREAGKFSSSAWAIIHAAWVCDDEEKTKIAKLCRKNAVNMIYKAIKNGQRFAQNKAITTAVLVDLLRRSGDLEEASKIIKENRRNIKDKIVSKILEYQTELINKKDIECHTIEEASIQIHTHD